MQGIYVPRLYGEATVYNGSDEVPALLIEFLEGTPLDCLRLDELASEPALKLLGEGKRPQNYLSHLEILNPGLGAALRGLIGEFAKLRMVHGDPRLDNFILRRRGGGDAAMSMRSSPLTWRWRSTSPSTGTTPRTFGRWFTASRTLSCSRAQVGRSGRTVVPVCRSFLVVCVTV